MPDLIEIEGGEVLANLEDRTITGLLIPYNEIGHTNVGRFEVQAGVITIPADPAVVSLNLDHDRYQPVGRATRVWEEPRGIMATFALAATPEGDKALADALDPNGKRRSLSGEFRTGIKAGKATGGNLAAGSLVEKGAFASAMVLASDAPAPHYTEFTDADGVTWRRVDEDSSTPPEAPAPDDTEKEQEGTEVPETTETQAVQAAAPAAVLASAPASVPPTIATPAASTAPRVNLGAGLHEVAAAIADLRSNPQNADARDVLAALADIKISGNGSLPTGANGTPSLIQPTWVGQLYQGIEYVREFITLGKLGTDISVEGKKGFTLHRRSGTSGVVELEMQKETADWAGNKAELSGYSGFSLGVTSSRRNFALGNDLAREFFDLPGGAPFIEGFLKLIVEHYFFWSDEYALADWIATAGAPVAPNSAAWSAYDYPDAMGMVIQGILAVKARKGNTKRRDVPTHAILNEVAYEQLAFAAGGAENLPAFVDFRVSTDGTGEVDRVQLVQGETGIEDTASVIVGARQAIEFDELPGGPLQINALDIAHGGIDRAVHGYLQTFKVRPEAVVLIGTADVP